jgi:hypothetical protein
MELINDLFSQAHKRKLAHNDEILDIVWRQLGCQIVLNRNRSVTGARNVFGSASTRFRVHKSTQ